MSDTAAATAAAAAASDEPPPPAEGTSPATDHAAPPNPSGSGNKPRRRRIVRKNRRSAAQQSASAVPDSIAQNPALLSAVSASLPPDYEFEIPKTVHRINSTRSRHVALQMPEGLLMYACSVADILRTFTDAECCARVSILGDVTYGACCVDDLGAQALGADLLVHYGHSCLVPITETVVKCMYVFVEIRVDVRHMVDCFCETCPEGTEVLVMGTVQFRTAVVEACKLLNERGRPAIVPQAKPLSPGEVLGCTAPTDLSSIPLSDAGPSERTGAAAPERVMLFVADGRFHLEAAMISNPTLRALRYDPYSKTLTDERYETERMKSIRLKSIRRAMDPEAKVFGIILGTLGRQGNPAVLGQIRRLLRKHGRRSFVLLLSEIYPHKLDMFPDVDAWVQIACPRLSVDWGHHFSKPVLSAYELNVAMGEAEMGDVYPMDFYRAGSGRWTNYHEENRARKLVN